MTIENVTLEELELLVKAGFEPKIDTPSGFEEIVEVYRKNSPGFHLHFSDGTDFKAARNHKILINDLWEEVFEIDIGTEIKSEKGSKTLIKKTPIKTQDWIDFTINAGHNSYYYNDMIHHNSGKSFIIYLIQQHYYRTFQHRTLIIVPTISLVHQMAGDFIDYGCDPDSIYKIQGGVDKNTNAPIVISTWQSLMKLPKEWFDQFRVVLGDEAHLFQAKSLTKIMEKLSEAPYRHGFTGTISSESKCVDKDTLITTNKGKIKISDIKVGDMVLTLNETDHSLEYKPVLNLMNNGKKEKLIRINTKSGSISVTEDHKIFTNKGWCMAKDITPQHKIAMI